MRPRMASRPINIRKPIDVRSANVTSTSHDSPIQLTGVRITNRSDVSPLLLRIIRMS